MKLELRILIRYNVVWGLAAFEHEGIQNITSLKEQLVAAGHEQTPAIVKRHGDVIARWQRLLSDSATRKQRLLQLQDQFRQIEELYLTFAKKVHHQFSWLEVKHRGNTCTIVKLTVLVNNTVYKFAEIENSLCSGHRLQMPVIIPI